MSFAAHLRRRCIMRVMELHAPLRVVSRGSGRSATAAAAYRSASRIECQRTGQVHDYTRKQGVEHTALLLPDEAPDWAHDRSALWNGAEMREKHPRAQPAREVEVSLPTEFTDRQRREAGLAIGSWIVMSCVFLMGTHSTFYVPNKYGVLPEIFQPNMLSRANGFVESTSFLAIILGTATGGLPLRLA